MVGEIIKHVLMEILTQLLVILLTATTPTLDLLGANQHLVVQHTVSMPAVTTGITGKRVKI